MSAKPVAFTKDNIDLYLKELAKHRKKIISKMFWGTYYAEIRANNQSYFIPNRTSTQDKTCSPRLVLCFAFTPFAPFPFP